MEKKVITDPEVGTIYLYGCSQNYGYFRVKGNEFWCGLISAEEYKEVVTDPKNSIYYNIPDACACIEGRVEEGKLVIVQAENLTQDWCEPGILSLRTYLVILGLGLKDSLIPNLDLSFIECEYGRVWDNQFKKTIAQPNYSIPGLFRSSLTGIEYLISDSGKVNEDYLWKTWNVSKGGVPFASLTVAAPKSYILLNFSKGQGSYSQQSVAYEELWDNFMMKQFCVALHCSRGKHELLERGWLKELAGFLDSEFLASI